MINKSDQTIRSIQLNQIQSIESFSEREAAKQQWSKGRKMWSREKLKYLLLKHHGARLSQVQAQENSILPKGEVRGIDRLI